MTDLFNNNRNHFITQDDDLKLDMRMFSAAGANGCIEHDSSPRGLMMSSHVGQDVTLLDPEEDMMQTGVARELSKASIGKLIETNVEVMNVIRRYKTLGDDMITEKTVIYREIDTGILNCMEIGKFHKNHPYFGFEYIENEEYNTDNLVRGDIIPAGTMLARSPGLKNNNGRAYGRDVNVVSMTLPDLDEDGLIASKSFVKSYGFKVFDSRDISGGVSSVFLNLHGDISTYKVMPDIGEYVGSSSVIFGTREFDLSLAPGLFSSEALMEFNNKFDNVVYARSPNSKVKDIKVYRNPYKNKTLLTGTNDQLDKYARALIFYYRQVIDAYNSVNSEYMNMFNRDIEVGNTLNTLLVEAYGMVESDKPGSKLKKMFRKETLDLYRVEVTMEETIIPTIGFKPTDHHGGKGTIVRVWEDEDMPVDADGNRSDLACDSKSTISRVNLGRLYERYIKAGASKCRKIITDTLDGDAIENIDNNKVYKLFNILIEFLELLDTMQLEYYKTVYDSDDISTMRVILTEIVNIKLTFHLSLCNNKRKYEIVKDIKGSKFSPPHGKVTFNYYGVPKTSYSNIMIAPMYIILLSKIADTSLATASSKVNHFGTPVVVSKNDKFSTPHRNSPVRAGGESEVRLYAGYGGVEFTAEIRNRNASTEAHGMVYESVLTANMPTNIDKCIDREKVPFSGDNALKILNTLYNSVGMELKYVDDGNIYRDNVPNITSARTVNLNDLDANLIENNDD